MAVRYPRTECLERLRAEIDRGRGLVMTGAGNGIAAKFIERGGVDLIGVYNTGYFRMQGYGSLAGMLPILDANELVFRTAEREVLPQVRATPVIAGVNGVDPLRDMRRFLEDLRRIGVCGVHNFPTVAWFDGEFRRTLEATGLGYEHELAMLRIARDLDMLTIGYAFNAADTERLMQEAAPDIYIFHAGITAGGATGDAAGSSLDDTAARSERALRSRPPDQARHHPARPWRGDRRARRRSVHARPYGLPWRPAWLEHRADGGRASARGARGGVQDRAPQRRPRRERAAMTRVPFSALIADAERRGYAVGYFESWSLESLLAVADAAQAVRSPVILGFSGIYLPHPNRSAGDPLGPYAAMAAAVADHIAVPACLLFNECADLAWVREAIALGFDLTMFSDDALAPDRADRRDQDACRRGARAGRRRRSRTRTARRRRRRSARQRRRGRGAADRSRCGARLCRAHRR